METQTGYRLFDVWPVREELGYTRKQLKDRKNLLNILVKTCAMKDILLIYVPSECANIAEKR
jgi:hypothetical protein